MLKGDYLEDEEEEEEEGISQKKGGAKRTKRKLDALSEDIQKMLGEVKKKNKFIDQDKFKKRMEKRTSVEYLDFGEEGLKEIEEKEKEGENED